MAGKHFERQTCVQMEITPQDTPGNVEQSLANFKRSVSRMHRTAAHFNVCMHLSFLAVSVLAPPPPGQRCRIVTETHVKMHALFMCSCIQISPAFDYVAVENLGAGNIGCGAGRHTAEHSARCLHRSHAGAQKEVQALLQKEHCQSCYPAALLSHHVAPAGRIRSRHGLPLHTDGVLRYVR